jgi:hypothetical protein
MNGSNVHHTFFSLTVHFQLSEKAAAESGKKEGADPPPCAITCP